jgi:hypothetical protein
VDAKKDASFAARMGLGNAETWMVVMGQEEDIAAIRERMLAALESSPPVGRSRVDSKAAKVRALMDVIKAYRDRFPEATNIDLLRTLNECGADIKLDTLRKVLKEAENATGKPILRKQKRKPSGTRKRKVTGPRNRTPPIQDQDLTTALVTLAILEEMKDVKPDDPPAAKVPEDAPPAAENATPETSNYRSDPSDHAGIRRQRSRP